MASDNPDIVYHYTSPYALVSILESKKIWATNYDLLNDKEELINSLKLFSQMANNSNWDVKDAIRFLETEPLNVAVFSLSSKGDSLSQWRSYCPPTGGYAIGFNRKRLNAILKKHRFCELQPCIYDKIKQEDMINNFIKNFPPTDNIDKFKKFNIMFEKYIQTAGLLIKNEGFNEEYEWRAISEIISSDLENAMEWKIRSGIYNLIQYLEVDLSEDFPIENIIIGPCRDIQLAKKSVDRALRIFNYNKWNETNVETEISVIPYRSEK